MTDKQRAADDERITERGWYWHDTEYPEEGSVGPFASSEAAEADALPIYADGDYDEDEPFRVFYFNPEATDA